LNSGVLFVESPKKREDRKSCPYDREMNNHDVDMSDIKHNGDFFRVYCFIFGSQEILRREVIILS
jgi:hypothetical protein